MQYQAGQEEAANTRNFQAQQTELANAQYRNETTQATVRQLQERDKASTELFKNSIDAMRARAKAEATAADANVQGNSIEAIARDIYTQQGAIDVATIRNASQSIQQLQAEKESAGLRLRGRTTFQPIREPSLVGLGLGIAGAGANAAGTYYNVKKAMG